MKVIYLIRHAEAPWDKNLLDFDRPLSSKGKQDIIALSKQLKTTPNIIISSPAKRTRQTVSTIAKALNYDEQKIDFDLSIYEAPLKNLIKKVNSIDNINASVFIIGHNPGITLLANYLAADFLSPVSPCTMIKIELEIDNWNEITQGMGSIQSINQP